MTNTHLAILLDQLLRRIHVRLHKKAKTFDTDKVGPGGAMILLTLEEHGPLPMQALTQYLVRDKSQMTRAVGPLERKGCLTRKAHPTDARVTLIEIKEKGRALVARHQFALADTLDEVLAPLSDAQRDTLQELLATGLSSPPPKDP